MSYVSAGVFMLRLELFVLNHREYFAESMPEAYW